MCIFAVAALIYNQNFQGPEISKIQCRIETGEIYKGEEQDEIKHLNIKDYGCAQEMECCSLIVLCVFQYQDSCIFYMG